MEKTEGTGERVGGYRVVRRLATGGTSEVLLAKAEGPHGFERSVVLKLLLSQYKHDDEFKGMFAREAAAYARLSHPSIVRLYDFFSNNDQLVMVLEYIDGPPLSRLRGMLKAVGQQFDDETAIYVAGCIFDALACAHAFSDDKGAPAPVIHRDVNPSNVLIPWDGQVKLADFGIAKVTGLSHHSSAGLIKGTYGYMAPEQVNGETVTPRADVYAGAIILWEMLTKRRAFIRGALPEIEVLRQLAEPRIVSIDTLRPDLDKNVRDAINRALEPSAGKRNMTAEEMVSTLRSAVPSDVGREKLARALASVRHEPKPVNTTMPPPMGTASDGASPAKAGARRTDDEQQTGNVFPRGLLPARPGMLPRMTPRGLPAVGVSRKTSPYGATVPAPPVGSASTSRAAPVLGPPRARSRGNEGSLDADSPDAAPATLTPSDLPPATLVQPPSEPGLASVLEPSDPYPLPNPSSQGLKVFDSLVEPAELVKATGRDSEKLRLATPLAGIAPGRGLREAIDEILRNVPSNVPPDVFPKTDPPPDGPAESPTKKNRKTLAENVGRELGRLPAAPAPLTVQGPSPSGPQNLAATLVAGSAVNEFSSVFPPLNRTLSMRELEDLRPPTAEELVQAEKLTERPPPHLMPSATVPRPAVAPPTLTPSTAKMRSFVVPQAAVASVPPPAGTGSSPPATLPLGALSPPLPVVATPPAHAPPHSAPPISAPPHRAPVSAPPHGAPQGNAHVATVPPNRVSAASLSGAHPPSSVPPSSVHPPPRGLPIFALAAVLVVAIVVGVGGTVGYVRWKKSRALAASTPPTVGAGRPTAAATDLAPSAAPSASAAASAPAVSSAPASASPIASAPRVASTSPPASTSSVAPAEDIPAGMGRMKTTGAAPGRRIFVDEKTVGQTPDAVLVKCGARAIKLGSAGTTRTVDVPCGGEIAVGDR